MLSDEEIHERLVAESSLDEIGRNHPGQRCRSVGTLAAATEAAERGVVLHHPVLLEPAEAIERVAAAVVQHCSAWD